jgi:hypothetical protein
MDGHSALRLPRPSDEPASVAILNGFGRTLGDGIIGLQALDVALDAGALRARPVLFRLPKLPVMVQAIYGAVDFAEIRTLPWEFATKERKFEVGLSKIIDLRDFAFDRDFLRTSMIDFFLLRLGVAPDQVPARRRRNSWLAPRVATLPPEFPEGYVLVCPRASMALRNMPEPIHAHIVRRARAIGPVVTQGRVPDGAHGVFQCGPYQTLEALCGCVRHAALVISTDTAMVHLADAFDVPCLAFFPTHVPQWRVRDYPRCMPIALQSELPCGIEFARGPEDEALAWASWFPSGDDLTWLDEAMLRAGESLIQTA